jgi:hypothetical protein
MPKTGPVATRNPTQAWLSGPAQPSTRTEAKRRQRIHDKYRLRLPYRRARGEGLGAAHSTSTNRHVSSCNRNPPCTRCLIGMQPRRLLFPNPSGFADCWPIGRFVICFAVIEWDGLLTVGTGRSQLPRVYSVLCSPYAYVARRFEKCWPCGSKSQNRWARLVFTATGSRVVQGLLSHGLLHSEYRHRRIGLAERQRAYTVWSKPGKPFTRDT